jgi:transglutaminase-like putative cysteine protease
VARTLLLGSLAGALVAWNWLRLEQSASIGKATLMTALALAPALVPGARRRVAAAVVASLFAGGVAFDLAPGPHFLGRLLSRFGGGFLDFYDVQVPFAGTTHARMHGVLLLAVFAFTLAVALAVEARRAGAAALALVAGAGWPATLLPGDDLLRGAFLLVGVLVLLVGLRRRPFQGLGYAAAAAGVVVLVALAASSSPALAKQEFLNWQNWDLYTRPAHPVEVGYVWDSSYGGLTFPRKQTTVLRIRASTTPEYWRATVLNTVTGGRWIQELAAQTPENPPLGEPDLVSPGEADQRQWQHERVTVEALSDHRLVGGSVPVYFEPGSSLDVIYDPVGVAYAQNIPRRGDSYDVWSYSPRPTPAQLIRSKPIYPELITKRRKYLEVERGAYAPPFGTAGRERQIDYLFTDYARAPRLRPYRRLYELAHRVAGGAKSPYAAAVALERWFRTGGDFVYDQHPPQAPKGVPPLVYFAATTHRGYCQHYAGAMALMLRYLGIPTRVAAGFTSGRYDRGGGEWVVSDRDAHAWVEVWFRGWGWLPFDPTPSRGGLPGGYSSSSPSFDVAAAAHVLAGKAGLAGFQKHLSELGFKQARPPRVSPDVPDLRALAAAAASSDGRHSRAPGLLTLLLLLLTGLAAAVAAVKLTLRRARYLSRNPRRLASACRKELRDFLRDQQVDVPASATLRELAALVESEFGVEAAAFGLHATVARFGPAASAREASRAMRGELRDLRRALRGELTRFERVRGLLSLRSLGLA